MMSNIIQDKITNLCNEGSQEPCLVSLHLTMITGDQDDIYLPILTHIPDCAGTKTKIAVVSMVLGDVFDVWGDIIENDEESFIGNVLNDNTDDLLVKLLGRYQEDDWPGCPDPHECLECHPDVDGRGSTW